MTTQQTTTATNGQCTWKTDGVQCTAEKIRPAAGTCETHVADWKAARDARRAAKGQTPKVARTPREPKAPARKRVPKHSGGQRRLSIPPTPMHATPVARVIHTIGNKPIGPEGAEYGVRHDYNCPGCINTPFTASPRSETYWAN